MGSSWARWGAIVGLLAVHAACQSRGTPSDAPVTANVPRDAHFFVSAPRLSELEMLASHVEPVDITPGDDGERPAWLACVPDGCILSRTASVPAVTRHGASWLVPSTQGSLVVWGPTNREQLDALLRVSREGTAPTPGDWKGYMMPGPLLARWKPTQPRAKELLARVGAQAGRIDFELTLNEASLDGRLRMQPLPGEPTLVGDLGRATGALPAVTGLLAGDMLSVVRLSASAEQLWMLLRSTLDADTRSRLDALEGQLAEELHFDVRQQVLGSLTGEIALFAYAIEPGPEGTSLAELLTLSATREAVLFGVKDRDTLRRALDAWTQISQSDAIEGSLQFQRRPSENPEWAWVVDGELRWSLILGEDSLLLVDSSVAMDHARTWTDRTETPDVLEERGATRVLEGDARSGIYLDLARLRVAAPEVFGALPPQLLSATVTAEPDEAGSEIIGVRLSWAPTTGD